MNGWSNRETWLFNLWFGDSFQEHLDDNSVTLPSLEECERMIEEYIQEAIILEVETQGFVLDIVLGAVESINTRELAETYLS